MQSLSIACCWACIKNLISHHEEHERKVLRKILEHKKEEITEETDKN
jgi:Zn-finger protein